MKNIFAILIVLSLLLFPRLGMVDYSVVALLIFNLSLIIFGKKDSLRPWTSEGKRSVYLLLGAALLFSGSFIFHTFHSLNLNAYYFFRVMRGLVIFVMVYDIFRRLEINFTSVIQSILIACFLHTLICYFQIFSSGSIQEAARSLNLMTSDRGFSYRAFGLSVGYDMAGIMVALGHFCAIILFEMGILNLIVFSIIEALFIGALLFTSRTGIVLALFLPSMFYLLARPSFVELLKRLILLGAIATVSTTLTVKALEWKSNFVANNVARMAEEPFKNLARGKGFTTESTQDTFLNHYFFNIKGKELLTGNPNYVFQDSFGFKTDVGVIQIINGHGLLGLIGFALVIAWPLLIDGRPIRMKKFSGEDGLTLSIAICLSLGVLGTSLKGPYLMSRQFYDATTVIVAAYLISRRHSSSQNHVLDTKFRMANAFRTR